MSKPPPLHPLLQQAIQLSMNGRNAEAVMIITRMAGENHPQALALLAEMKWRGGVVPQDPVAGRQLWQRAADLGHAGSAAITTNLMANGVAGPRDWPGASLLGGGRHPQAPRASHRTTPAM